MSIRLKLLVSYIAMILVPVILFLASMAGLVMMIFSDEIGVRIPFNLKSIHEIHEARVMGEEQDRHFSGLTYLFDYDPSLLENQNYLRQVGDQLNDVQAAMILMKGEQMTYISPLLADVGQNELSRKLDSVSTDKWSDPEFDLLERTYSFSAHAVSFDDGSAGEVYFLSDITQTNALIQTFFPIVAFSMIGVVVLTNGLLTYFVSRSLIRPIKAMKAAAEHIKEGNLDQPLKLNKRKDELGQLGSAFEEMRVRLKESLRVQLQVEENRKELISSISHDLKTPITAIAGCADNMRDGIADTPEKQLKYINMIHKKAADMDRMIEELFLFSKLDLKKLPFHFAPLNLNAFLQDCVEELRLQAGEGRDSLQVALDQEPGAPVIVNADQEKLGRAIMNIVENSLKHMDKPTKELRFTITTNTEPQGDGTVTVRITDNGKGIEASALPHIFERFYRADKARTSEQGGSGLGLAIVRQIIEEHDGAVWADSIAGAGTTISIALPLQKNMPRR
ncbi:signal transduction histidine kinase [Paenibacillus phyllosphaerae]|uniref:histidine kinase n=1 Tax=Paenibacillus phyllosphaerae TaxID=274593 RepID=A0A7W5AX91_9BACL|nr:HAMP domain-containing sensor histidine kinase [Paenibacillus phyllosphaerae]MBB3110154.1 signal transduction histidine kinase [Paenibacillus phyllosphaerae]